MNETKNLRALNVAEAFVGTLDTLVKPYLSEVGVAEAWAVSTVQSEPYAAVTVIRDKESTIYRLSVPEPSHDTGFQFLNRPAKTGNRRVIEFNVSRDVKVAQAESGIEALLKDVGAAINAAKQTALGIARYEVRASTEERPPAEIYGDNRIRILEKQPEVTRTIFQLSPAGLDSLYAALGRANGGMPPFPQPIHTTMVLMNG